MKSEVAAMIRTLAAYQMCAEEIARRVESV